MTCGFFPVTSKKNTCEIQGNIEEVYCFLTLLCLLRNNSSIVVSTKTISKNKLLRISLIF